MGLGFRVQGLGGLEVLVVGVVWVVLDAKKEDLGFRV